MRTKVRCKLCGTDHPYSEDMRAMACDECGVRLNIDNTKIILPPRERQQADPLDGM